MSGNVKEWAADGREVTVHSGDFQFALALGAEWRVHELATGL